MLDIEIANKIIISAWTDIQKLSSEKINEISFIEEAELKERIKRLTNSETKSYRYAILTQVLAKATNPSINCLSIQAKAGFIGAFDARSFCKNTVVKFERKYLENILGSSGDPYVSKPLRHEAITLDIIGYIRDKQGWKDLYETLVKVETTNNAEFTLKVLKQLLLEIRMQLISEPLRQPTIPPIGMEQLREILIDYLSRPSEGIRPQAIVYALFLTFNEKTKAFETITTAKATTADTLAKRIADIECRDSNGDLKLAIAVTDNLNVDKLETELEKASKNDIRNFLLIGHRIRDERDFEKIVKKFDMDIAISSLLGFISTMTVVLNNEMRQKLVVKIYEVLYELEYRKHLKEWDKLIRDKLDFTKI